MRACAVDQAEVAARARVGDRPSRGRQRAVPVANTINAHLKHAFAKLNVRSRVQLARLVAERELASTGGAALSARGVPP